MPRYVLSLMLISSLTLPTFAAAAEIDRDARLIETLRALDLRVRRPGRAKLYRDEVERIERSVLETVGAAAVGAYAVSYIPIPLIQQSAWAQASALSRLGLMVILGGRAVRGGVKVGDYAHQRWFQRAVSMNPDDYKSAFGLRRFFQLPINKQYLIAIADADFVDYLFRLHESLEILNNGFPPGKPVPPSEGGLS